MIVKRRLAAPLTAVLLCAAALGVRAQPMPGGLQTKDYKIETAETKYNLDSGVFTMPRKVRFYRPGTDGTADRAQGNATAGTATLSGHVEIHDSGNAPEVSRDKAYRGSGPATIWCDQLDVNSKAKTYAAQGNVRFSQGNKSGSAQRALLDRDRGTLHLEGNVHLSDNGATLSADVVDYNLNTKDVEFRGAPAVMTQPKK